MEFKVNKKKLIEMLNGMGRIASSKSIVPIMQNVKISIRQDGTMVVAASDTELSAMRKFQIAESFETPFEFCVSPRDLSNGIKSLRDEEITLGVENGVCTVKHSKGEFSLPSWSAEAFPTIEMEKSAPKITVKAELLFEWLKDAVGFASSDEFRQMLCGVHIYAKNGELGVAASDGYKLFSDYVCDGNYANVDQCGTLGTKAVSPLLDMINDEDNVVIYFGEKKLSFRTNSSILSCVKPAGAFPNFKALIARKEKPVKVNMDKNDFIDSISRSSLSANAMTCLLNLKASEGVMSIDSEDLDFNKKCHEELPCENEGTIEICVKGSGMVECLSVVNAPRVYFEFGDVKSSINIFDEERPNKSLLFMPSVIN